MVSFLDPAPPINAGAAPPGLVYGGGASRMLQAPGGALVELLRP
jgi:hypothetical protein